MNDFDLWEMAPRVNEKVNFATDAGDLQPAEEKVLSKINGLISLGELASNLRVPKTDLERIVAKLSGRNLIVFADPRVRKYLATVVKQKAKPSSTPEAEDAPPPVTPARTTGAEAGDLLDWNRDSVFFVINWHHAEKKTGVLRLFRQPGEYKALYFERGLLANVHEAPFQVANTLGRLMQRAGMVKPEEIVESLKLMQKSGRKQGEQLLDLGAIRRPQLFQMLELQMEVKLADVIQWEQGKWSFEEMDAIPDRVVRVGADMCRVMFNLAWKHYPLEIIERQIEAVMDKVSLMLEAPPYTTREYCQGDFIEDFFRAATQRRWTVRRLHDDTKYRHDHMVRLIWTFYLLGAVRFADEES